MSARGQRATDSRQGSNADGQDDFRVAWRWKARLKGNTLMNFFGLNAKQVPRADRIDNPKYSWAISPSGARMWRSSASIAPKTAKVDCLLLLAWNFEKEIRRRCQAAGYKGRFLVPVPEARLVEAE